MGREMVPDLIRTIYIGARSTAALQDSNRGDHRIFLLRPGWFGWPLCTEIRHHARRKRMPNLGQFGAATQLCFGRGVCWISPYHPSRETAAFEPFVRAFPYRCSL